MATYLEIRDLASDSNLQDKITVAVIKKAQTLIDAGALTANAKTWCSEALSSPRGKALEIINYVLAANSGNTVEQITGASDDAIQTNVDTAVDALIA